MEDDNKKPDDDNSLESPQDDNSLENSNQSSADQGGDAATGDGGKSAQPTAQGPKGSKVKGLLAHLNIYLLGFIFVLVLAGAGGGIYYVNGNQTTQVTQKSEKLTTETLSELSGSGVTVGDSQQVLTIQSSTIFDGPVLLKKDVQIAGRLIVGGKLSLSGINVSGQSSMQDLNVTNNLSVTGDVAVKGKITVQKSLNVNGAANFKGALNVQQIAASSLLLSGPLNVAHHIIAAGGLPSRSSGTAIGGGGTTSLSGSDSGGSITINTGSNPPAGCFVTVNFTNPYQSTPHVVVTPIGSAAAELKYYVTRNTGSFSVCSANAAPAHASFGFDYWVAG